MNKLSKIFIIHRLCSQDHNLLRPLGIDDLYVVQCWLQISQLSICKIFFHTFGDTWHIHAFKIYPSASCLLPHSACFKHTIVGLAAVFSSLLYLISAGFSNIFILVMFFLFPCYYFKELNYGTCWTEMGKFYHLFRSHCLKLFILSFYEKWNYIVWTLLSLVIGKGTPIRHVLGKSKMILGLLEGIPTMQKGEIAMVLILK